MFLPSKYTYTHAFFYVAFVIITYFDILRFSDISIQPLAALTETSIF